KHTKHRNTQPAPRPSDGRGIKSEGGPPPFSLCHAVFVIRHSPQSHLRPLWNRAARLRCRGAMVSAPAFGLLGAAPQSVKPTHGPSIRPYVRPDFPLPGGGLAGPPGLSGGGDADLHRHLSANSGFLVVSV